MPLQPTVGASCDWGASRWVEQRGTDASRAQVYKIDSIGSTQVPEGEGGNFSWRSLVGSRLATPILGTP
jgi:hypothetical protein